MSTSSALSGYRGLRGEILIALKKSQPLSAKELADRFAVTPNALRRHLEMLEADGVVRHASVTRGVGAPVFTYSLTPDGEGLFPSAYAAALLGALEMVVEQAGTAGVVEMFRKRWDAIAEIARPELERLPLAERARMLAELLSRQGYMAESVTHTPTRATITEHNCAIRAVAEKYPEVCEAESEFLQLMLGGSVERRSHILTGCNACEYDVQAPAQIVSPVRRNAGATTPARAIPEMS
jgi:DeoR family suf operon transcriptional repressor